MYLRKVVGLTLLHWSSRCCLQQGHEALDEVETCFNFIQSLGFGMAVPVTQ